MNWRTIFVTSVIIFSGTLYVQADSGVPQVRSEAGRNDPYVTWDLPSAETVNTYRRAAEQGDATAQFRLAVMYYGGDGVPQDFTEAASWFRKAAEKGDAGAQKNLGVMYGKGQGVPQSHAEAYVWTDIAAKSGDEGAMRIRDYAASTLSSEDLGAAQNRVAKLYEEIQQKR
jgi:TPR repeat protein